MHRASFIENIVDMEELKSFYEDKEWMLDRLEQFEYDMGMLANLKTVCGNKFYQME